VSDEDTLDALADAIATLPEPVAAAAAAVELARAEGDATGIRKRAFELGIAVVRYGVSVGLALLSEKLGEQRAPKPLQRSLGGAARMSDGQWCELLRAVGAQVEERSLFRFASNKPVAELVRARNRFAHEGTRGDEAPGCAQSVLEDARELLALPLRVVASEGRYEERRGVPLRAGAWRKREGEVPSIDGAYLLASDRVVAMTPWLPAVERRLWLIDAPAAASKAWRSLDPESGERRDAPELGAAIRKLVGEDASLPVAPSERPTLVGRGALVNAMRRTAERAREGGVYVLVLSGPQGIGRGRLLELMRDSAAQFGFGAVLESSCSPMRRSALRPLRRALSDGRFPDVARAAERAASGEAGQHGLEAAIEAVEETLVEASRREPLLWLLDDAQWADEATLALLSLLAERAARMAEGHMLVMAAIRDEPGASSALRRFVGEVEREVGPAATRLALGPLDDADARKLVASTAPMVGALEDALVGGAAGVPFYLVQSALAWFETGALVWKDGRWHPSSDALVHQPVPGMADVVRARLTACFADESELRNAEKILFLVGAAASWLPLAQLLRAAAIGDIEPMTTERVLEALVDAGIVQCRGAHHEYSFAQPMVRRAVVSELEKRPWRPRLHRAFLDVLVESPQADEDAAFLAQGYRALGDHDQARAWLERAVRYALRLGSFREADERAAELASIAQDSRLSIVARILRVTTAAALGRAHADDDLVQGADAVARELGIEARVALARQRRGQAGLSLAEDAASRILGEDSPELRYRVLVTRSELLSEVRSLTDPACRAAIEQTAQAARAVGSSWALLDAENDLALLDAAAGETDTAVAKLERVVTEAGACHFGSMQRGALVNIAALQLRLDRFEASDDAARRAADLGRVAGDALNTYKAQSIRAEALRHLERLADARSAADEAVAIALQLEVGAALPLLRRADIRAATGDVESALHDLELAHGHATRAGNASVLAQVRLLEGILRGDSAALARTVEEIAASAVSSQAPVAKLLERARLTAR
jgi:tetratricopeptide (TPR) repeat protein